MSRNAHDQARHRDKLRRQGMRLLQIWVPDTRAPGFAEEARRQGDLVGATYVEGGADADLIEFWEQLADADRADAWR